VTCRRGFVAVGAAVCLTLGACGGPSMTDEAARELATKAQEVRAAASSGNRATADAALASLRASVDNLRRNGALDDGKTDAILTAANVVDATLPLMPTTTTTLPPVDQHGKGKEGKGKHGDN
jgi:hypothetical protein